MKAIRRRLYEYNFGPQRNARPDRSLLQRRPECTGNSSSDENRSSGHASMSDTGGHTSSSSPPHRHHRSHSPQQLNAVPEDDRLSASVTQRNGKSRSGQSRNRHRATPAKVPTFIRYFLSESQIKSFSQVSVKVKTIVSVLNSLLLSIFSLAPTGSCPLNTRRYSHFSYRTRYQNKD